MSRQSEKPKVLIVDDIRENLFSIEKVLTELDVDIITATSGNEALKATLYHDFSLILMDILMPGMSGFEVAEMLKQEESTSNIPIVFITSMDKDESSELKAYSKGAIDFIYKPFNRFVLLSKVKILLDLYALNKDYEQAFQRYSNEKPKILIVDDTPENILVLTKLLQRLETDIVTASNGNEALTATIYDDFAVIFLDVQMPGMDGYEVAELLKSNERTAGIPIIFITAIDRDDAKEIQGYDKGAVDFIFKPFNEFILLTKAKVFLDIYNMKAGLGALVAEKTSALRKSNKQLREEIKQKEIAESKLLQTRTYLSSVVNSISSALIGADTDGLINDMNREASSISGISPGDAQGRTIDEVFPFFAETLKMMLDQAKYNEPVKKTLVKIVVNGTHRIYNFAIYPLIGSDMEQIVIRVDDVTETRRMEEELQQRRHIESLGQLAGGIAHDFNNMLSAISGAADLLRLKAGDAPDFKDLLDSIFKSVERSSDLTGKLLSFARKKGGEKSAVDIHRLIGDTVSILQRSIDKRIDIDVRANAESFIIEGDESELHNALLNMGINARDAMPDGGTLTISSTNRTLVDDKLTNDLELHPGLYLHLCIEDTGTGMPEDVKQKVFEPFFTTKAPGKGTGLGLASVYGTVKSHSGAITLESTPGEGSSFTVLLPVSDHFDSRQTDIISAPIDKEISGTVLLVDDEDLVRKVGTDLLIQLGMDVITADNGLQAIDIIREKKDDISLIILDLIMPEMNGPDCYVQIKKIMPGAKVILCSGYAPDDMIAKLQVKGVRDFIRKPFRIAELKNAIRSCLSASTS